MPRVPKFKIVACLCLVAATQSACAQLRNAYLYMQLGGGWGTENTLNIGATLMYKRWAITYDYIGQHKRADNVPSDYNAGLILWGDGAPKVALEGSCIEAARVIYFANGKLRFLARGGIFIGTYHFPQHFYHSASTWFGPNYEAYWQTNDAIGLVLHPTIEWPGSVPFGFSSGLTSHHHKYQINRSD
jgi:hypothetical protein